MELEYYAILTEIGTAAIANAMVLGQKVALTQFAVGDGGGSYYRPTKEMTALKGEKWRGEINSYEVDSVNPDLINVKAVLPALVGGFTVREMGLFDDKGQMIAVSNTPDSVKITTDSGAVKEMELVMELLVSNANIVTIQVNPTVSIATKEDIDKHNQSVNSHKKQFDEKVNTSLNNVTRETLLSKTGNVTEKLERIVGTTGDTGGTATAGTLTAKVNALIGATSGLKVKSVQSGYADDYVGESARSIKIKAVDVSKSVLISDTGSSGEFKSYGDFRDFVPYLYDSTTIKQSGFGVKPNFHHPPFNWTIVEFE